MKVKLQEGDYVAFCYEEFSDRVGPISLGYELHQLREGKLEQSLIVRGWDRQEIENAKIKVVGVGGAGGNAVIHMINHNIDGVDFIWL